MAKVKRGRVFTEAQYQRSKKRGRKCRPQKKCPTSKRVLVAAYWARRCTTKVR